MDGQSDKFFRFFGFFALSKNPKNRDFLPYPIFWIYFLASLGLGLVTLGGVFPHHGVCLFGVKCR